MNAVTVLAAGKYLMAINLPSEGGKFCDDESALSNF